MTSQPLEANKIGRGIRVEHHEARANWPATSKVVGKECPQRLSASPLPQDLLVVPGGGILRQSGNRAAQKAPSVLFDMGEVLLDGPLSGGIEARKDTHCASTAFTSLPRFAIGPIQCPSAPPTL